MKKLTGEHTWNRFRELLGGGANTIPDQVIRIEDGRQFHIGPDYIYLPLYLNRTFEPVATSVLRRLIRPGDVVVDAGANYGWYTTLAAELVGENGRVLAFEPVPSTHERLLEHLTLNHCEDVVSAFQMALGADEGQAEVHLFDELSHSRSSLATLNESHFDTFKVSVAPLDGILDEHQLENVALLKCDVEGSELNVFRGAIRRLRSPDAPIVLVELNEETSRAFGYTPSDLCDLLRGCGYDHFYELPAVETVTRLESDAKIAACGLLLADKGGRVERRMNSHRRSLRRSA